MRPRATKTAVEEVWLDFVGFKIIVYVVMRLTEYSESIFSRITITKDTKVPNAAHFTINKEDHTVGNLLRS